MKSVFILGCHLFKWVICTFFWFKGCSLGEYPIQMDKTFTYCAMCTSFSSPPQNLTDLPSLKMESMVETCKMITHILATISTYTSCLEFGGGHTVFDIVLNRKLANKIRMLGLGGNVCTWERTGSVIDSRKC